jgi:hypothetical protein
VSESSVYGSATRGATSRSFLRSPIYGVDSDTAAAVDFDGAKIGSDVGAGDAGATIGSDVRKGETGVPSGLGEVGGDTSRKKS